MSATDVIIVHEMKKLDIEYMKKLERLLKLYQESGIENNIRIEKPLLERLEFIYKLI